MTRRKRHGCRPNRTPAAGRRDRRQSIGPPQPFPSPRRARQAKPGASPVCGLPLVQPPRRFLPPRRAWDTDETADASPSGSGRGPAFRAEAAEARGESRRVFRARRDWRRAGSPRGADAEAKARGLIHLAESCRRGARKSSERAVPRAAAVDKKPVSHCPAGKSGISVNKDSAPGVRCVSSRPSAWKQSHEGRGESRGHLRTTLSDDQQRSIRGAETERLAVG